MRLYECRILKSGEGMVRVVGGREATEGMIWCAGEGGGELQRYGMVWVRYAEASPVARATVLPGACSSYSCCSHYQTGR